MPPAQIRDHRQPVRRWRPETPRASTSAPRPGSTTDAPSTPGRRRPGTPAGTTATTQVGDAVVVAYPRAEPAAPRRGQGRCDRGRRSRSVGTRSASFADRREPPLRQVGRRVLAQRGQQQVGLHLGDAGETVAHRHRVLPRAALTAHHEDLADRGRRAPRRNAPPPPAMRGTRVRSAPAGSALSRAGATATGRAVAHPSAVKARARIAHQVAGGSARQMHRAVGMAASIARSPSASPPAAVAPDQQRRLWPVRHDGRADRPGWTEQAAAAGSESGASAMPSVLPRGTPSIERRDTSTVFGCGAPIDEQRRRVVEHQVQLAVAIDVAGAGLALDDHRGRVAPALPPPSVRIAPYTDEPTQRDRRDQHARQRRARRPAERRLRRDRSPASPGRRPPAAP